MKKLILLVVATLTLGVITPANAAVAAKHHHGHKAATHAAGKHGRHHYAKAHHHKHA